MQTRRATAMTGLAAVIAAIGLGAVGTDARADECTQPQFPLDVLYGAGNRPVSVAIADLDGDHDPDLAVANFFSDDVSILSNDCAPATCAADLEGSGDVGLDDLLILLANWGECPPECVADLDGSGEVGLSDLLILLGSWGPCS